MSTHKHPLFLTRSTWIALLVAIYGLVIIAGTLVGQFDIRRMPMHLPSLNLAIDLPLLFGLALLYISLTLFRRKRTAWLFAMVTYAFLFLLTPASILLSHLRGDTIRLHLAEFLLVPVMLALLWFARKEFVVRSDIQTFASSVRVAVVVLITALLYGTTGFMLMDNRDFHQEITPFSAIHYTVDQFDLTTNPLTAYTRRAALFQDSLTFISVSAVGFVLVSLFQPLRARYVHQKERAELAHALIYESKADSEDFFKVWPQDKEYFFDEGNRAVIAYKAQRGVALAVSDPVGESRAASRLVRQFEELCFVNDWRVAFIHTTPAWSEQFKRHGYKLQGIGQEAIVDVAHFEAEVAHDKYFRQIKNRFTKLDFTTERLQPPHHQAVVDRLKAISDEWLRLPGREERRFMMGYFSEQYIQQCDIFVARDAAGTIQAFLNLVPSPVPDEANYDMLRSSERAPGNVNDYLLLELLADLNGAGIKRLNMGLSPLAGLEDAPDTLINRTLRFVYSNGDRFYSFQGLYRFKAKYQPVWSERYIAYKGGPADLIRVMRALTKAMQV